MNKYWNSKKSVALRRAMLAAVTPKDVYDITKMQLFLALRGDTFAVREIIDRCVGKAASVSEMIALENSSDWAIDRELIDAELRMMRESVPSLPEYPAVKEPGTIESSDTA